ncbi:glycoside hydrolase family 15 protein [Arthrobacter globiformis]|uniref:glycoside hydrolase family 15 protein n=1 Tax=Arthrobacter globiformis TaxID=1665 RepID=UPI0027841C10|nr:glycoside hydrolase family 15 protein [Arthrobacter globiformis]MDQ0864793.1 GH15 family glucan-1,4-alpha-glucosidase [Arthrobacter globiformis]
MHAFSSHEVPPAVADVELALQTTGTSWRRWSSNYVSQGNYDEEVQRSLLVLRALTHERTGGIVAAPTTSLTEQFGGQRKWDYRYCSLRALALEARMTDGFHGPVGIGNRAVYQYQGDIVGEVMVALAKLRERGVHEDHFSWPLQTNMLWFVENNLNRMDHGIWEMRGKGRTAHLPAGAGSRPVS